jgi:hypothetical protein
MDNVKEFFAAIRAGNTATARTMLEAEPALATAKNERGQSPIVAAVYSGRADIRDLRKAPVGFRRIQESYRINRFGTKAHWAV